MSDGLVEEIARAIETAQCVGREGPFGGYDYGYPDDKPVEGGRYVIRDFRDPRSPDWGQWLHQSSDREEHEAKFAEMTRHHIAGSVLPIIHRREQQAAEALKPFAAVEPFIHLLATGAGMTDEQREEHDRIGRDPMVERYELFEWDFKDGVGDRGQATLCHSDFARAAEIVRSLTTEVGKGAQ